jgi:predicted alpha/beta hydrolase family esterase
MKKRLLLSIVLVLALAVTSFAIPTSFGSNFSSWLSSNGYGSAFPQGGFGGTSSAPSGTKQVVIFIHGNGSIAWGNSGDTYGWQKTYDYLKSKGWNDTELYAVNYPYNSALQAAYNHHSSDRIAIVKNFINAVYAYTGKQVTVIAHSLGCTMTRKAMKDGNLYSKVKTFISISGGNHGLATCGYWYWGIYYCVATPTCSRSTGLCNYPYGGDSDTFVRALNSSSYGDAEMSGKTTRTYVIRSSVDEICMTLTTPALSGAYGTQTYSVAPYGHFGCKDWTADVQYKMVTWTF